MRRLNTKLVTCVGGYEANCTAVVAMATEAWVRGFKVHVEGGELIITYTLSCFHCRWSFAKLCSRLLKRYIDGHMIFFPCI